MDAPYNVLSIVDTLRRSGYVTLLVGGCVRDTIMQIKPKDYDIATSARPNAIQRLFPDAKPIGAHFGVMQVDGVEVATFRADGAYSDSRRPDSVEFANSHLVDMQRRDFTINGMYFDPIHGILLDDVCGRQDIFRKQIRCIGDANNRFNEDALRMLRAVRFAARFNFGINLGTKIRIAKNTELINNISKERIHDELVRMITDGNFVHAFNEMPANLLEEIIPELKCFDREIIRKRLTANATAPISVTRTMAALLLNLRADDHQIYNVCTNLKFTNADTDQIISLVDHNVDFENLEKCSPAELKRFMRLRNFADHITLFALENRDTPEYEFIRDKYVSTPDIEINPPKLITGLDLIAAGYTPNPAFRDALFDVETQQLNGVFNKREDAMNYVATLPYMEKL